MSCSRGRSTLTDLARVVRARHSCGRTRGHPGDTAVPDTLVSRYPSERSDVAATEESRSLAKVAAQAAADKKATDVVVLDVSEQLVITDCFLIASAPNERQVGAIVESVEEKMRKAGSKVVRREGEREGRWVLLDFTDVVVHVQHSDERSFYELERLWKDCPRVELDGVVQHSGDDQQDAET